MFSKENRPGFGTAIIMALPLLGGCMPEPPSAEAVSSSVTELANTETLRPVLEERMAHCPAQYKELVEKTLGTFDAVQALIKSDNFEDEMYDNRFAHYKAAQERISELRLYLLTHRDASLIRSDPRIERSADQLFSSCGAALDVVSRHHNLEGWGRNANSASMIALSQIKSDAAALIYDCTAPQ